MASRIKPFDEYICGGKTRITYVWSDCDLVHAEITHVDKQVTLKGFPPKGHFAIKVKKALVKTTENVGIYEVENYCKLSCHRKIGGPILNDITMKVIDMLCETPSGQKRRQIAAGDTRPFIVEKVKTTNVFATALKPNWVIDCEYKPHSPQYLDKHPVLTNLEYNIKCQTANVVEFAIPHVFLYGENYRYTLDMTTYYTSLLKEHPTMILILYGQIYETTEKNFTAEEGPYFSGLNPYIYDKKQAIISIFESDIDTSDEELEAEVFKKEVTKIQ